MTEPFDPKQHCDNIKGSCRIEQTSIPVDEANSAIGITSIFQNVCIKCDATWVEIWNGEIRVS